MRADRYGAIVGALYYGDPAHGDLARATVGATPEQAVASARRACERELPVSVTCKAIRVFSEGCWYVATGKLRTQARYAADRTWAATMSKCEQDGFSCTAKKVGVCVSDDVEENETGE